MIVRKIGLYNLINLILVKERVRPAFLLQPQDKGNENIRIIWMLYHILKKL